MSSAAPSFSSRFATAFAKAAPSLIRSSVNFTQTEVLERVAGSTARFAIQAWLSQKSQITLALASARAIRPESPPVERAQSSATR